MTIVLGFLAVMAALLGAAVAVGKFIAAGTKAPPEYAPPTTEENAAILSADAYRALRPRDEITEAARRADARMAQEPRDRP